MPSSNLAVPLHPETDPSVGGRLVTVDGRTLPLKAAALTADAKGGVIRVTLSQTFVNPHAEPLEVTYQMPLPADAAVSGFAFTVGERKVVGEVDLKRRAKERFEEAILSGRTAALLDEERSSLFTQKVGNIPPRAEVVSELTIDQRLSFLADGYWEWRFPTVVAPRYLGASGTVPDAAKVSVDVADQAMPVRLSLQLSVRDRLADGVRPESPSHSLHTERGVQRCDVTLAAESGASLDRDVVVRWQATAMMPGVELDTCRPFDGSPAEFAYGLVTIVPPSAKASYPRLPRDLIVLLDTSGSMSGEPLEQARRVTSALVDSLTDDDQLELIEFSNSPRRWKKGSVKASSGNRKDAQAWLSKLRASGGTEMRTGILEALAPLRPEAQRQVVLMTDGLIGFEDQVVRAIADSLPSGSRVHTVGIGSGVNRSLTAPAARAGRGVEQVIALGEDPERAAQRILARTVAPQLTDLSFSGSAFIGVASEWVGDVFAGSPSLVPVKLRASGGELRVHARGAGGDFEQAMRVPPVERGEGSQSVAKLFARELVEDLELRRVANQLHDVDGRIEELGVSFQISTRLTSWVAVSAEATVDPRAPRRKDVMPQELPFGMSAEGLGLRGVDGGMLSVGGGPIRRMRAAPSMAAAPAAPSGAFGRAQEERELNAPAADRASLSDFDDSAFEGAPAAEPMPQDELKKKESKRDEAPARTSRKGSSQGAPPRPPASPAKVSQTRAGRVPKRLAARIVVLKDGTLAIEVTLDGLLAWDPTSALIRTARGTWLGAAVDFARTTAAVSASAGMTLTLVLSVPGDLTDPDEVTLVQRDGEPVVLELTK